MNSAEMFDISTNQWSFIPQMQSARSGVSLIAFGNTLYAMGGFNGYTRLATGEKFTPDTSAGWSDIAEMLTPRSNFATVILDDYIFVIGGFNDRFASGLQGISWPNTWNRAIENHGESRVVALDISKAFDGVWHEGLLAKLAAPRHRQRLHSFLNDRSLFVVVEGCSSEVFSINVLLEITSNPIYSFADDSTLISCMDPGKPLPSKEVARRRHHHASQINEELPRNLFSDSYNLQLFKTNVHRHLSFCSVSTAR
nr:unnamed protein product [Callosobruchus analis]